jgi:hypothetical protein
LKLKGFEEVVRKEEVRIPTHKEYATLYLEGEIKPIKKKGTYERYKSALEKHIFPVIGKKPINQISRGFGQVLCERP